MAHENGPSPHPDQIWIGIALRPSVVRRGQMDAAVVGEVPTTISGGVALLHGELTTDRQPQTALTVSAQHVVSTPSSIGTHRSQRAQAGKDKAGGAGA